jgi:hypothetical protein
MFAAKSAPVALGIARRAMDVLIETATNKAARRYTLGEHLEPSKMMRDDVFIQDSVGRADTMLTSARAYLFEVMGDFWDTLVSGGEPSPTQVARFTTMHTYVVGACVAVYQKGPLDRCLRDVLTMNQHVVGTIRTYEMAGRLLLGMEPLRWLF